MESIIDIVTALPPILVVIIIIILMLIILSILAVFLHAYWSGGKVAVWRIRIERGESSRMKTQKRP